jgi:hypothetical protein
MLYAEPGSPKGDEVLGRLWFFVKQLGQTNIEQKLEEGDSAVEIALKHAEYLKRSVVLAVLEAAEMTGIGAHTHCQTRVTGELLKFASFHLKGSKLRPLHCRGGCVC